MENMYDIHCHALQQVDDGADSLQMALDMLAYEYTEGVRTIILTPHFRKLDVYKRQYPNRSRVSWSIRDRLK